MRLAAALLGAAFVIASATANAQGNGVSIVMSVSATCTLPQTGPGSSEEDAIPVSLERLAEDAETVAEYGADPTYDCRWIRTVGQFRAVNYWHYRGQIKAPGLAIYDPSRPRLWVENFADPDVRLTDIQQRNIELVGIFYDLCRVDAVARVAAESEGEILINMGGPCHYGGLNGLMLTHVRVDAIRSERPERLRGEANREAFGDLVDLSTAAPGAVEEVRAAALTMLAALAESERAYLEHGRAEPDYVAERMADGNDPTSLMANWAAAATASSQPAELPYRAFALRERGEYGEPDYDETYPIESAVACFCTAEDCADEWPLLESDSWFIADTVMCLDVEAPDDGWPVQ